MTQPGPVCAVSSWSLHRTIGLTWWDSPDGPGERQPRWGEGRTAILDIPAEIARNGYEQMHLCHFHVERRDPAWVGEFKDALERAGVTLGMVLIDDGDITDSETGQRDCDWAASWIETAAALGARSARVIAGKQPPTEQTLARASQRLAQLSRFGRSLGVHIYTENWFALTPSPHEVDHLLDAVGPDLGLLADFGNWSGQDKYDALARILARAGDTHAKAGFGPGLAIDGQDYGACLDAARTAGYAGPFTLIYDGPDDDEWKGLAMERAMVQARFV